jgi:hypothetical protein
MGGYRSSRSSDQAIELGAPLEYGRGVTRLQIDEQPGRESNRAHPRRNLTRAMDG